MVQKFLSDGNGLFQQDNVVYHRAKIVKQLFKELKDKLEVLTCPPNSPDLSTISDWMTRQTNLVCV